MRRGVDTDFLVASEVASHPKHAKVKRCYNGVLAAGDTIVFVPLVLSEFVHVSTDARRFIEPLTMPVALQRSEEIWRARETEQLHTSRDAVGLFLDWMVQYRLGRKRILDTLLGSTLHTAGVVSILTLNPSDFRIFGCFEFHPDSCRRA